MKHRIVFIAGDGIGPEVAWAARKCVSATGLDIEWMDAEAGEEALKRHDNLLPDATLESIREARVAIKGPITTPIGKGFRSVNVALRKELDLFACLRPCRTYAGVRSRFENIDLVIVRENTEDLYAGIEFQSGRQETQDLIWTLNQSASKKIPGDAGISIKPISPQASNRICRFAFDYAVANGRKKVTAVTKANIMKFSDGLFLTEARRVADEYSGRVDYEDRLIDATCMKLVMDPQDLDTLVLPNLYGDIVSDLCAGLIGGLGVAPGANVGDEMAVFEAVHGSAPGFAGKNQVNPTAMILSAVLMLRHIGEEEAANRLESAVAAVIAEGKNVTFDFKDKGSEKFAVGTSEMTSAIIERMKTIKVGL